MLVGLYLEVWMFAYQGTGSVRVPRALFSHSAMLVRRISVREMVEGLPVVRIQFALNAALTPSPRAITLTHVNNWTRRSTTIPIPIVETL